MRTERTNTALIVTLVAVAPFFVRCEEQLTPAPVIEPSQQHAASAIVDPAAERLQDICGDLLLYYSRRHQLPPSLQALGSSVPLTDAQTRQPLVYHNPPIAIPKRPGGLLLHSPARNTQGGHWAVLVKESPDHLTLTTQVVSLSPDEIATTPAQPR